MAGSTPPLALSTAWCSHRHTDGYAMLKEVADLGFEYVELSHGIRVTLVPGVLKAVSEGVIKVSSTHNFCPLPPGIFQAAPNIFEPSSRDTREQDQWLRHTRKSLDMAAQLKARVLVCHLGSTVFLWFNPVRKLNSHLARKKPKSPADDKEYQRLLAGSVARMRKRMAPFWERTKANVGRVLDYAAQKGVRLGFENREKFEELPMDADFPEFIGGLSPTATVGYWHDTGHAELKQRMGLLDQRQHLERNAPRLIGFHLHDVDTDGHDHRPVGTGNVDFEMISSFWRPDHVLVLELGPRTEVEGVRASKERIEVLVAKRFGG